MLASFSSSFCLKSSNIPSGSWQIPTKTGSDLVSWIIFCDLLSFFPRYCWITSNFFFKNWCKLKIRIAMFKQFNAKRLSDYVIVQVKVWWGNRLFCTKHCFFVSITSKNKSLRYQYLFPQEVSSRDWFPGLVRQFAYKHKKSVYKLSLRTENCHRVTYLTWGLPKLPDNYLRVLGDKLMRTHIRRK